MKTRLRELAPWSEEPGRGITQPSILAEYCSSPIV